MQLKGEGLILFIFLITSIVLCIYYTKKYWSNSAESKFAVKRPIFRNRNVLQGHYYITSLATIEESQASSLFSSSHLFKIHLLKTPGTADQLELHRL